MNPIGRWGLLVGLLALAACHTVPVHPVLTACGDAQCGHIERPLDPTGRVPGTIRVGFALYPHRDAGKTLVGSIVATEGGPGFPTTGSASSYLPIFAPLLGDHDLLLIDNRGTGTSSPIDCEPLQTAPVPTVEAVGQCGHQLGAAANFYGTGLAADDMAAVLDALGIGKIDLYGDSYGTFTAQAFAGRHPDRLRSLVLDGAFPVVGASGYFPNAPAAIRKSIELVCARSPSCRGSALDRVERLLAKVRQAPIHGTIDAKAIGTLLYNTTYDPANLRELDAAIRADLDDGDDAPLLRLVAEDQARSDSRDPTETPATYSYGLFAAVSCADYPQIYDMRLPVAEREAQRDAAIADLQRHNPKLYAPLTIAEWRSLQIDYSVLDLCVKWPVEPVPYPPGQPVPPGAAFTAAPVLVISGELDSTTPPADADMATALFPHATHLLMANSFHVDAVSDQQNCASAIVRRFVATLDPGDTSCAARIPPIRPVPAFVRRVGKTGDAVSVAVATAGDVLARWWRGGAAGAGLRGGGFTLETSGDVVHAVLKDVRWAEDLAVSGTVDWDQTTSRITATLSVSGAAQGSLTVTWNDHEPDAKARIDGTIDGRPVHTFLAAP